MACVNTKEKSFKELVSKYDASSGTVENAIKIYMDKNNLETYDTNSQDFIDHMDSYFQLKSSNFYSSKGKYNRAHALWEKINPTQNVADIKTATKEYNALVEIFGGDNVTIFETSDGGFRVRAAEPIFNSGNSSENETTKETTVEYTPIGKSRQTYTIKENKIFNKEGKEVFKTDSVDRNRIFANLAVQQGRAVVVSHKNKEYVVNNRNQIISVATGKMMQWDEKNEDRNAIIKAAQEKFNRNKPSENIQKPTTSNPNISLSTVGYKKGDPQRNPNTDYVFTENAEAYAYSNGTDLSSFGVKFPNPNKPKINVSDVSGTNQAGIRTDNNGNISQNAYGIVVKKYQQDVNGRFVAKEGQFQNTEEDFKLFTSLNEDMFDKLSKSSNKEIVFPTQMGLGKAALPLRFAKWLKNELENRFGIVSKIEKNTRADYDGFGLKLLSVKQSQNSESEAVFNWGRTSDNNYEVSSAGDSRFSAFNAKLKPGTKILGVTVPEEKSTFIAEKPTTTNSIEYVYQTLIKKSGKGKAPAKDSKLNLSNKDNYTTTFKNFPNGVKKVIYEREDKVPRIIFEANNETWLLNFNDKFNKWEIARRKKSPAGDYRFYSEDMSPETKQKAIDKYVPKKILDYINSGQLEKDELADLKDAFKNSEKSRVVRFFRDNFNVHFINEAFLDSGKNHESFEDFSYYIGYLPLWQEWARQNPELIEELRTKAAGKTLTDQFADTRVSQARALADILNSTSSVSKTTEEAPNISEYINIEGANKGFLTKKGEELLGTTFNKDEFNPGTVSVKLYPGVKGTTIEIGFISSKTGHKFYALYNGNPTRKVWDLLNSEQQNITNVNDEKYWKAIDTIVPKSLRDLVESGKYNEMDSTARKTDDKTFVVTETELENYFEEKYNVFKQGRSTEYNTNQINKALNTKSETIEEAPIFEEENDNMQSTKELVDRMIADSKEHIKFNSEDHSYTVDGKKADTSVTQFIHGKKDLGQWGIAASAIGTTADSVTRDFFKGELKNEYPNLSDKDLSFLKHDLKSLRNFFDKKFGKDKYTVVTEEFPIASKYTYTDQDGKLNEGIMAGTMDMLIYDNEGNFYIYDMKTSRSGLNENKIAGYAKQLTLYKAILEANYPELKGKIKELKLIQFRVGYPQPSADSIYSATDGQLYLNNVPIQETDEYSAPQLDFTGKTLDNQVLVPVEPVSMNILFEGMTENEVESMKEETREPESTEFSQNEVDSQRGNLYGNPLLSATERTFLANNVMNLTSFIVTHLQTNPEANQFYFGDQFSKFNFTKMSREDIISTVGVTRIFEYIKERWYNPDNRTDIDDFDTLDKLQIAYDNWTALVKSAYAKLITLEGITVVAARPDEISREDIETSFQEQIDAGELEEKEREYWQLGIRNISARSSLSGDIRRSFERLFAIDSNGNPIKDKFGFNFDTFVDSGVAVNSILEWTRTATTIEEMEEILDGMKDSYPWLNSILNKIKEEPFRSQFFQNFRKDFTQYSIVTVERDEKGNKVYQTQIINTKGASQSILDEITTYYNSGLMQNIIITADGIEGKGRVNVKNVEALKAEKDKIVSDLKGAFTAVRKEVYNNTLKNSVPKITKLLNELGIRVDTKTVSNTIVDKGRPKDINNSSVMKLLSEMSYIFDTLLSKKDSTSYNPLLKGEEKNIYGNYKSIVGLMSKYIQDSIESSSYENGKMHYSFVTPSYMGKLILNLKDAIGNPSKFNSFMEENYGSYRWFREEDGTWNNAWLELISESKDVRQGLEHKVQLSFDGTPYTDLSELGYTLSLMSEYFYDKGSRGKGPQWAWYRVPMLSNKPSSEFIRFKRYSGSEYKRRIKRGLKMVLNQEILRIQTVLDRATNPNIEKIGVKDKTTFDISDKVLKENPSLQAKLSSKNDSGVREPLEHSDLVKDGKLITAASGASFKFLEAFNQNIVEGDELGMMLIDKINGVKVNEDSFDKLVNQNLDSYMDIIVSKEISQWKKIGLFDTEEVRRGEDVETRYKYISNLTRSYSTIKKELFGRERKLSKEQKSEIMQVMESEAKANLEEYVWNDMFATINIIQLTATDLAYYKNVEDFQKRYAQVHSPAMRLNITARDSKGRLYSADGMERTMYLSDYKVESDIIPNVEEVFDQKISSISDPSEKANMKMMKDLIVESFRKINVADAQGYSSPTSYRKKMGMMGKWSDEMEEAYNRIKRGDFNVNDLDVVWQPLKPFVYSQIRKPSGSNALSELKIPVQNKNSEYLLLLADALMRGGKKQSKLAAIFDFMEESAYDGRETKFNPKTNTYEVVKEGTYNGKGIDTVQFISAVNSGAMGAVNINNAETYEEIKNILNSSVYFNEDRTPSSDNNNDRYNTNYVHTIPFEDYGIQQEVPAHLEDHEQLMGSQMRILSISDITPGTEFQIGDEHLKSDELISEYQNLIKENIEQSFERLCKDFKVRGTRLERNKALEKILQEAIEKDQRYGADIQRACSLDKNGEFIIPLSDPIQSIRIQQLLNSIIKSRINKQKVTGGPVVQASVFGMSDDLSIRFKDKDGNLIETYSEFVEKRGLSKDKSSAAEYKKFIKDKQASVAYFECYMPIPSSELEEALTRYDKDGHAYIISMEEAVKEGIIPEEMRKAIGYRIPTEDKYSMAPLYIKGFLPKAAGEAVMLPKEITLLSGSDFDIDKLYVMLKTFTLKKKTDWNKLEKDILKSSKATGEEKKKRKEALKIVIDQIKAGMEFSEGTFEMNVYDYYYNHRDRYNRTSFELSNSDTDRRNNRIFDLQWAVLTNPDTMSKMFNPGSFDVQKKTARIVRILQETNGHTYQELSKLNLDQLDEILDSSTDRNIIYSTSQVYFHKQNMTAGKLIGIFANNNTSHAFISMQGIDLKLGDDLKFTFDGVTVDENQNNRLDPLKGKNGSLISKTIAGFLAASVDAVKDPVLNFMNLNTFTSGPAMVLARLGFDSDSIGLLLSQPIIRRVTDEYFRRNNEGYISAEDLIDEFLEQDKNAKGYEKTLTLTNFSKEELAQGISLNSDKGDFQTRALILFKRLSKISQDFGTLTFLTKFNSVTNAVGPTIADTLVMKQRYKKFLDKFEDDNAIFSDNAKYVIQNSPILDAFYTTTVSDTGASQLIFQGYFPQYSDKFNQVLEKFRETTKANVDSKTINSLVSDFVLYKLTGGPNPVLNSDGKVREEFIHDFIVEFKEKAAGIVDNELIKIITVKPSTGKCPVPTLEAKTGGYTQDVQERVRDAWTNLITNESTRDLGVKLFFYNMYRTGLSFSPKTFLHLASTDVKLAIPGYVESVRDINYNDSFDVNDFLLQYRRNHTDNFRVVPHITQRKGIASSITEDGAGNRKITFTFASDSASSQFIVKKVKSGSGKISTKEIVAAPVILYNDKVYFNPEINSDGSITYTETTTLGNTNNFLEYDMNESGSEIKTSIQRTSEEDVHEKEVQESPAREVSEDDGEDEAVELSETDVENILSEVFDEDELNSLMISLVKGQSKKVDKYKSMIEKHIGSETASKVMKKMIDIVKGIC